jgi:hypothetical protein
VIRKPVGFAIRTAEVKYLFAGKIEFAHPTGSHCTTGDCPLVNQSQNRRRLDGSTPFEYVLK